MSALVCLALAALSLLVPSAPTTDPWGWIAWGHELVWGGFTTVMGGAPSWKPLPVLITAPLALAGAAAPTLWLLVARAGSLYSLVVARRLGDRLGGPPAGLLAAAGLVLSGDWLRSFAHGYSEPLAIGLLLATVEGHLAGRPRRALVLGAAMALIRPEALVLLAVYAVVLVRRRQAPWTLAATLVAMVPVLWVVPDWLGSGIPLHGGEVARAVAPQGAGAALRAVVEGALIAPLPLTACALIAPRQADEDRRAAVHAIGVLAGVWAALVALLLFAGYPASSRFFVLPAALVCVLGAVGAVRLVRAPVPRVVLPALGAVLAATLVVRAAGAGDQAVDSAHRAMFERDLGTAIARARPSAIRRCGKPVLPRGLGWTKGVVAFRLGERPARVRSLGTSARGYVTSLARSGEERVPPRAPRTVRVSLPARGFVLLEPFGHARIQGGPRLRRLASAGRWRVLAPAGERRCEKS